MFCSKISVVWAHILKIYRGNLANLFVRPSFSQKQYDMVKILKENTWMKCKLLQAIIIFTFREFYSTCFSMFTGKKKVFRRYVKGIKDVLEQNRTRSYWDSKRSPPAWSKNSKSMVNFHLISLSKILSSKSTVTEYTE